MKELGARRGVVAETETPIFISLNDLILNLIEIENLYFLNRFVGVLNYLLKK